MANQRKFNNYVKNARLSKRYYFYAFVGSLIFVGGFEVYAIQALRQIGQQLTAIPDAQVGVLGPIYQELIKASLLFFGSFLVYSILAIIFVMFIEQKVGGPTVAILRFIEELKAGNYDYRRKLRNGDELKNIMDALHGLAVNLKEKEIDIQLKK